MGLQITIQTSRGPASYHKISKVTVVNDSRKGVANLCSYYDKALSDAGGAPIESCDYITEDDYFSDLNCADYDNDIQQSYEWIKENVAKFSGAIDL